MISDVNIKEFQPSPPGDRGKRMHPYKFTLWVAIGSIVMMFAGLTSAFIVKSNQVNFTEVAMPGVFWFSTAVMILSSMTLQMALRSFKQGERSRYRFLVGMTLLLGIAFLVFQWMGFQQLWEQKIRFRGAGAGQFLYVIFGLHGLHVIAGVLALMIMFIKAFFTGIKQDSSVPGEVMATYWHFVDFLWIYLMIFFLLIG